MKETLKKNQNKWNKKEWGNEYSTFTSIVSSLSLTDFQLHFSVPDRKPVIGGNSSLPRILFPVELFPTPVLPISSRRTLLSGKARLAKTAEERLENKEPGHNKWHNSKHTHIWRHLNNNVFWNYFKLCYIDIFVLIPPPHPHTKWN